MKDIIKDILSFLFVCAVFSWISPELFGFVIVMYAVFGTWTWMADRNWR